LPPDAGGVEQASWWVGLEAHGEKLGVGGGDGGDGGGGGGGYEWMLGIRIGLDGEGTVQHSIRDLLSRFGDSGTFDDCGDLKAPQDQKPSEEYHGCEAHDVRIDESWMNRSEKR
jgi:hypothetical protein